MIVVSRALFVRAPHTPVVFKEPAARDDGSAVHHPLCKNVCHSLDASCHDRERFTSCAGALTVGGIGYLDDEDLVLAPQGIDSGSCQPSIDARWKFANLWDRCEGTLGKDRG